MHTNTDSTFITTVAMPFATRARLDQLRADRAEETGRRPSTRALLLEAIEMFMAHHATRVPTTRRRRERK